MPNMLTDKQVGAKLSISSKTVWRYARELSGFPQPIRLSPRVARWIDSDLDKWMLSHKQEEAKNGDD